MSDEPRIDPVCAVCERRLLPGERAIRFVTRDGMEVDVCELCKPRAEAAGWLRPEDIESAAAGPPARTRRRPRGAQVLGGLLGRRQSTQEEPEPVSSERPHGDAADDPAPPPPIAGPSSTAVGDALNAFNNSDHRRTVAGLSRTLGPPRATAISIKSGDGLPGVRLTIAWELTWYQWEVGPSGRGHDVRESGKGETIDQLRSADRTWNLMVDPDGTLEQKASSAAPVDGE